MIELAGGATLQSSHVPLCTLLLFGRLPRLTRKIFSLKMEREFADGSLSADGARTFMYAPSHAVRTSQL